MRYGYNKYGAKRTEYNGVSYHSKKEANYAAQLDMLLKGKVITQYQRQVPFKCYVNGVLIGKYILDFQVHYPNGMVEYIDVKGYKQGTAYSFFKWKKKHVEAQYGIQILEQ